MGVCLHKTKERMTDMVTSIARQSVILKCNMQKAVMLGNYEFYYGAGVAGKIGGFEIPDDIKTAGAPGTFRQKFRPDQSQR